MSEILDYRDNSPYRVVYTHPGADIVVHTSGRETPIRSRNELMRYAATTPRKNNSLSVIEVEKDGKLFKSRTITNRFTDIGSSTGSVASSMDSGPGRKSLTTMTDTLAIKKYRTSSKTGTLYFAFGTDLSPSYLKSKAGLPLTRAVKPVAVARLRGWQWIISAKGVPNVVPLCEPGMYNDKGSLRTRENDCDANIVYGLIYYLNSNDEAKVDVSHGYKEHGPLNSALDLNSASNRPFLQGDNDVNKRYEKVDIVEWFSDPLREGVNIIKDTMHVKCLVYVDESTRGIRPGRIWDDEADALSKSVASAIRKYKMPRNWISNTMVQHGIKLPKDHSRRSNRSRSRSRSRARSEVSITTSVNSQSLAYESDHDCYRGRKQDDDKSSYVETHVTRRITQGYDPLLESDFYRTKKTRPTRYISAH